MNYQQPFSPYGQNNQYNYNNNNNGEYFLLKSRHKASISAVSKACGISVTAFIVLGTVLGLILATVDGFYELYSNNEIFVSALTALMSLFTLGLPFLLAYNSLKKKNLAHELPLGKPYDNKEFALLIPIGVMICIFGSIATGIFSTFTQAVFGIEFSQPDDGSTYSSVATVAMSFFSTAVVPAFVEEFAIRGVVMQSLRKYGDWFAIIMSSFVFALMHGNMIQIPFAFIAGIGIGYAVIKTGTMWTGVIIHFINNSIAIVSMVVTENCTEQTANIFAMLLYAAIFGIGVLCLIFYAKDKKQKSLGGVFSSKLSKGCTSVLTSGEKAVSFIFSAPMIIAEILLIVETSLYIN